MKRISLTDSHSHYIKENRILFEACSLISDVSGEPSAFIYKCLEVYTLAARDLPLSSQANTNPGFYSFKLLTLVINPHFSMSLEFHKSRDGEFSVFSFPLAPQVFQ